MIKQLCYIGIFLLATTSLFAQRTSLEKAVLTLFEKPSKVIWLRHFYGKVDDASDVVIVLAYNGKFCKGRIEYLKSGEELGLVGFMKNQRIRMVEVNQNKEVSGYYEGRLNGNSLEMDWASVDNTIGSSLRLKESIREKKQVISCSTGKWVRTFKGQLGDDEVEVLLQREGEDQLHGVVYFETPQSTVKASGKIKKNNEIELTLTDDYEKLKGSLRGHVTEKGIVEAVFLNPYGARTKGNLWEHTTVEVGCVDFADYVSAMNITYPKLNNEIFNKWIEKQVALWQREYEEYAQRVRLLGQELSPDTRSSVRTAGWFDLDLVAVNMVSGTFWISNSWENETHAIPFTFDLVNERPITLGSIFERDFNLQDFIWAYLSKDIKNHQYYKDYDFRKWLSTASFDSYTIRKEGINFSTSFDATYGQQQITIPYAELKPYINSQSPVYDLAENVLN